MQDDFKKFLFILPESDLNKLKQDAQEKGISVSGLIRMVLKKHLKTCSFAEMNTGNTLNEQRNERSAQAD